MPYLAEIDDRILEAITGLRNINSKKMFGGICHLYQGNMFCGVYKDNLILRVGDEEAKRVIASGRGHPFDITGRPMKGWVMVPWTGSITGDDVKQWIDTALAYVKTLEPK